MSRGRQPNTVFGKVVKIELIKRGMTGKELARGIGITESTLSDVIAGRNHNPRVMRGIVNALGLSEEQLRDSIREIKRYEEVRQHE